MINNGGWIDCGTYWLNSSQQGSQGWHEARYNRLTASKFGAAIGKSQFSTPEKTADHVAGIKYEEHDQAAIERMSHGTQMEPLARDWYCKKYGVEAEEVGIAIPKWNVDIGGSLDGMVYHWLSPEDQRRNSNNLIGERIGPDGRLKRTLVGAIEIKCPKNGVYWPLKKRVQDISNGIDRTGDYSHIYPNYYAQMQGCIKISNLPWCDFIVFCPDKNDVYVERVEFNEQYWTNILEPGINDFITHQLKPRRTKPPLCP